VKSASVNISAQRDGLDREAQAAKNTRWEGLAGDWTAGDSGEVIKLGI